MKLHKFYSTSCGICGRMSHYDNKVATELGLEFKSYKKNTEPFNSNSHLLDIVREDRGRVGFPAYVVTDDDGNYKGNVMGGYDKGKFREALKQVLNGEAATRSPAPGSGDCPFYTMSCSCFCFESTDDSTEKTEYRTSTQESLGGNSIGSLEKIGEYDSTDCSESACQSIDKGDNDYCSCEDNGFPPGPGGTCKLVCYRAASAPPPPDPGNPDPPPPPDPEPEPPPPPPPPTVDPIPPGANDGAGNCEPGDPVDPDMTCKTGTILTTGYTDPTFYTHAFDPGMVRSVQVIHPYDPDERFMRIVFDPHVCDVDEIIESACLCTSYTADGDPILEFGEVTVTRVDDYTVDVVIKGTIIETNGYGE